MGMPGWRYAPAKGASLLRQMLRARTLAAREAGLSETAEDLLATGKHAGLELAGYRLGAAFIRQFADSAPHDCPALTDIAQETVGGAGLWLRAEPGEDRAQADALAAFVAMGLAA